MSRILLPILLFFSVFLGSAGAVAQNVGPDEAIGPRGQVDQQLALTAAQKSAIYDAVLQQRVRPSTTEIPLAVGAPVSPVVALSGLPDDAAADQTIDGAPWVGFLKYAMVESDVVLVDSVKMRVVDIIHGHSPGNAHP